MPTLVTAANKGPVNPVANSPGELTVSNTAMTTSLTLSCNGVQFNLTPTDPAAQVSFHTNTQGLIVLDLANFTGSLQVAPVSPPIKSGTAATASPLAALPAKRVEEEPNSPAAENNTSSLATVTPGQQKLSFQKKNTAKKSTKKRSNSTNKTVTEKKTKKEAIVALGQATMEIPTQGVDMSQTMPSSFSTSSPEEMQDTIMTDAPPEQPEETVQEILDRVNSSNDSVAEDDLLGDPATGSKTMDISTDIDPAAAPAATVSPLESTAVVISNSYPAPSPRWGHTMTKLKNDLLLVYGGQSFDLEGRPVILSDVHVYDPKKKKWDKPINCRGEARQWHSTTFLPERQLLLAFGGETYDTLGKKKDKIVTSDSLKVLDTEIMLWYPPAVSGDVPSGRSGHTATLLPSTNEVVLFGGVKGSKWLNTVTVLDTVRWIWTAPKIQGAAPKPRSYHSTTAVKSGNGYKMVVFGGNNMTSAFSTVHVLEPVSDGEWKWSHPATQGQAPFPRTGHSATLLEDGKTICFYGGWDPNEIGEDEGQENIFKTSFLLDTETWTWNSGPKATPCGSGTDQPLEDCGPKRCGHTAAVHPETGEVVAFGGRIPGEILAGDFQALSMTDTKY